jgi:hypothetical protein
MKSTVTDSCIFADQLPVVRRDASLNAILGGSRLPPGRSFMDFGGRACPIVIVSAAPLSRLVAHRVNPRSVN